MRIAVVGTGYVGLVSGACLAETGVTVVCVDVDASKIQRLNGGGIPIYDRCRRLRNFTSIIII